MRGLGVTLAVWITFAAAGEEGRAACLQANADAQSVTGRLTAGKFKDAAGRPETAYILQLAEPVCLGGADEPEDNHQNVRRVHVFSSKDLVSRALARQMGKVVRVQGSPFPAHTAHHHAPIVMDVSSIEPR